MITPAAIGVALVLGIVVGGFIAITFILSCLTKSIARGLNR